MPSIVDKRPVNLAVAAALCAWLAAAPARAESIGSMAASSVSSAGSKSAGSASDSLKGSSNSSTGGTQVADGPYQVLTVAEAADRPGHFTLHLRPEGPGSATERAQGDLWLTLPHATLADTPVAAGDRLLARVRPHGVAFARADAAQEPFFLALSDQAARELGAQALRL